VVNYSFCGRKYWGRDYFSGFPGDVRMVGMDVYWGSYFIKSQCYASDKRKNPRTNIKHVP
jgi:hypothetical protein